MRGKDASIACLLPIHRCPRSEQLLSRRAAPPAWPAVAARLPATAAAVGPPLRPRATPFVSRWWRTGVDIEMGRE